MASMTAAPSSRAPPEDDTRLHPDHEFLDDDRHGAVVNIESQLLPVEQRGIGPQRGPHEPYVIEDGVDTPYIQERFMEPRERGD